MNYSGESCGGVVRNAQRILAKNLFGKRLIKRLRMRWKNSIKIDIRDVSQF
jgi:hypothetical protein